MYLCLISLASGTETKISLKPVDLTPCLRTRSGVAIKANVRQRAVQWRLEKRQHETDW